MYIHVNASTSAFQILRFAQNDKENSLLNVILNAVKDLCTSTYMHKLALPEILRFALNDILLDDILLNDRKILKY